MMISSNNQCIQSLYMHRRINGFVAFWETILGLRQDGCNPDEANKRSLEIAIGEWLEKYYYHSDGSCPQ
jgi:hypothetical protein